MQMNTFLGKKKNTCYNFWKINRWIRHCPPIDAGLLHDYSYMVHQIGPIITGLMTYSS